MISTPRSMDGSIGFRRPSVRQMREKISSIRKSIYEFKEQITQNQTCVNLVQVGTTLNSEVKLNIKQSHLQIKRERALSSSRTSIRSRGSSFGLMNPEEKEQSIKSSQKSARRQILKFKETIQKIRDRTQKKKRVELVPVQYKNNEVNNDLPETKLKISDSQTTIDRLQTIQSRFEPKQQNIIVLNEKKMMRPKTHHMKKPVQDKSLVMGMLIIYSIIFIIGMLNK